MSPHIFEFKPVKHLRPFNISLRLTLFSVCLEALISNIIILHLFKLHYSLGGIKDLIGKASSTREFRLRSHLVWRTQQTPQTLIPIPRTTRKLLTRCRAGMPISKKIWVQYLLYQQHHTRTTFWWHEASVSRVNLILLQHVTCSLNSTWHGPQTGDLLSQAVDEKEGSNV